jgi:hypothetical protein
MFGLNPVTVLPHNRWVNTASGHRVFPSPGFPIGRIKAPVGDKARGRRRWLAKLEVMLRRGPGRWMVVEVVLVCSSVLAGGQAPTARRAINLIVVDENGLPVSGAEVTLSEPALYPMQCRTDFAGRCAFALQNDLPYHLRVEKLGFYEAVENQADAHLQSVEVKLAHEQVVLQEVDVVPSPGGIDL